ncbi:unnamed protein product [Parnassius mnemosyne]|uniref:Uncharacterized protein n=1 Tax=Parnassius mnemosyne TaxID=213953 RepID=A0AAV1LIH1_9NEOP
MSQSWRVVLLSSSVAVVVSILLLLSASSGDASPVFGLIDAFKPKDAYNGTSLVGSLALKHIENSKERLNKFKEMADRIANASETAILRG